jgi:hypothetical protein
LGAPTKPKQKMFTRQGTRLQLGMEEIEEFEQVMNDLIAQQQQQQQPPNLHSTTNGSGTNGQKEAINRPVVSYTSGNAPFNSTEQRIGYIHQQHHHHQQQGPN